MKLADKCLILAGPLFLLLLWLLLPSSPAETRDSESQGSDTEWLVELVGYGIDAGGGGEPGPVPCSDIASRGEVAAVGNVACGRVLVPCWNCPLACAFATAVPSCK